MPSKFPSFTKFDVAVFQLKGKFYSFQPACKSTETFALVLQPNVARHLCNLSRASQGMRSTTSPEQ